ncbi:MAG: hypothetical protein ABEJ72_01820 [Candidatus Aenigmatarchaeota archaeon]
MDRFSKVTAAYLGIPIAIIVLAVLSAGIRIDMMSNPVKYVIGLLVLHIAYLKFFLDDVVSRDRSRIWLPLVGIFGVPLVIAYLLTRE